MVEIKTIKMRRQSNQTPQNRRSMLGFGSATSKLKQQTNPPEMKKLQFSANRSSAKLNTTGGVGGAGKRWSSQGSHQQFKDPRPLTNRAFQKQLIEEILEFLMETGYPHQISAKILSAPTTKEFLRVFEHLYSLINSNFKMDGKFSEEIPRILKQLKYPYPLSKSAMFAIGSLHTWPALLGALHWLVNLIRTISDVDVEAMLFPLNSLEDENAMQQKKLFFEYFAQAYKEFMEGQDDFTEAYEELEKALMVQGRCSEEDHAYLMDEISMLEHELEALESEPDALEEASQTKAALEEQITRDEAEVEDLDEKEQVIGEQKKILYQELSEAGVNPGNLGDSQRQDELKHKSAEIKQQLEVFNAERERLEEQNNQREIKYSRTYNKSSAIIREYNNIAEELARKPFIKQYIGDTTIILNYDHTVKDMTKVNEFKEKLKPFLIKLSSKVSEDRYQVEAQNITEKDKQDQLQEVLIEKEQEASQLKLQLSNMEKYYEAHQESLDSAYLTASEKLHAQQEYLEKELKQSCEMIEQKTKEAELEKLEVDDRIKKYEATEDRFADFLFSYVQEIKNHQANVEGKVDGLNCMLREQIKQVQVEDENVPTTTTTNKQTEE